MRRKDLLVLMYNKNNSCCVDLVRLLDEEKLSVDVDRGRWEYYGRDYKIGEDMRHCETGHRYGVIGVYDLTNLDHLRNMVKHSHDALTEKSFLMED